MIFNYEPHLSVQDKCAVRQSLEEGLASPHIVKNFESELSEAFSLPTVCCASGTASLHLALLSLNISLGDEVICPAFSFAATWNVIEYVNATPIICDICPVTWCLDMDAVESRITPRTKAIISVDLYGNPCDYQRLQKLCKSHGIKLIIDAAQSIGSLYQGVPTPALGDIGCTSLNLNKIITSCGGGTLSSPSLKLLEVVNSLLNQSKVGPEFNYSSIGYNYRMNSLNAALGLSQLKNLESILIKKKALKDSYIEQLGDIVKFQKETELSTPNNWMVVIEFFTPEEKERVKTALLDKHIEARDVFTPVTLVPWFRKKYLGAFPAAVVAHSLYRRALSLPSGPRLSEVEVKSICQLIKTHI